MATELETDKLVAPVLPADLTELSLHVQQYLRAIDTYMAAMQRDLTKVRGKADGNV